MPIVTKLFTKHKSSSNTAVRWRRNRNAFTHSTEEPSILHTLLNCCTNDCEICKSVVISICTQKNRTAHISPDNEHKPKTIRNIHVNCELIRKSILWQRVVNGFAQRKRFPCVMAVLWFMFHLQIRWVHKYSEVIQESVKSFSICCSVCFACIAILNRV